MLNTGYIWCLEASNFILTSSESCKEIIHICFITNTNTPRTSNCPRLWQLGIDTYLHNVPCIFGSVTELATGHTG